MQETGGVKMQNSSSRKVCCLRHVRNFMLLENLEQNAFQPMQNSYRTLVSRSGGNQNWETEASTNSSASSSASAISNDSPPTPPVSSFRHFRSGNYQSILPNNSKCSANS
eukprot:NODE_18_length_47517_cov_0.674814.p31 type:complete len:110 gc:universal NODE_18_length_47517_cov_0.674814:30853-31182(+)